MFQHQMLYGKYICIAQLQKVYASHKVATYVMYQSNPSLPHPPGHCGSICLFCLWDVAFESKPLPGAFEFD